MTNQSIPNIETSVREFLDPYMKKDIPDFRVGDVVRVLQKIKEGDKERVQAFEGLVIARKHGSGLDGTFTVRKVAIGVGVEKIYPLHSPTINKIEVVKHAGRQPRAKLYWTREKSEKEIRLRLKLERRKTKSASGKISKATPKETAAQATT